MVRRRTRAGVAPRTEGNSNALLAEALALISEKKRR
jgi:hypothetical protein